MFAESGRNVVKIGINGFGRIGRNAYRAALAKQGSGKDFDIIAVNDVAPVDSLAYLLKYDSVYGKLDREVKAEGSAILVGDKRIEVTRFKDPGEIPWKKFGVDVVIESTSLFTDKDQASKHKNGGARKVIISAPSKDADVVLVLGVNMEMYDTSKHDVISMGSCTTGSLAPPAKVLNDKFGIERGSMLTVHAYTSDQRIIDLPHKDFRRGRAAALSIIPTSTGAAKAIGKVIPELEGKMNGLAMRVPTPCGSVTDISFESKVDVTADVLNKALLEASQGKMKGIMAYSTDPIVSTDVIGDPHSSIIDSLLTMVVQKRLAHVFSWYDNEWGYANRLVELAPKLL